MAGTAAHSPYRPYRRRSAPAGMAIEPLQPPRARWRSPLRDIAAFWPLDERTAGTSVARHDPRGGRDR